MPAAVNVFIVDIQTKPRRVVPRNFPRPPERKPKNRQRLQARLQLIAAAVHGGY